MIPERNIIWIIEYRFQYEDETMIEIGFRMLLRTRKQVKHHFFRGPCEHRHNFHLPALGKSYMYICARCLGLYGGFFLLALIFFAFPVLIQLIQDLMVAEIFLFCFFLSLPLVVDWLSQSKGLRHSSNVLRTTVGLLTALAGTIMLIAHQFLWITLPVGISWLLLISYAGRYWKNHRSPLFGCYSCKKQLKEAEITVGL